MTRRFRPTRGRNRVPAVIAWTRVAGRQHEIAAALGGHALVVYPVPEREGSKAILFRYAVGAARTLVYLIAERPTAVIVTNPPVFPALIAFVYGRLAGIPIVLDGHPGAFGLKGSRVGIRMLPVTRWLTPRVAATLVTGADLSATVEGWGGSAAVAHEAPPSPMPAFSTPDSPPAVLFVCTFAVDEPVDVVVAAAALRPDTRFWITGNLSKAPRYSSGAPPNVRFLGYLEPREYARAIAAAAAVIALTDEPTSVVRAGCEAVYALKPLIVSDTAALREAFPHAAHVTHTAEALATAVDKQLATPPDREDLLRAREEQISRWDGQLDRLRALIREHATSRPT